MQAERKGISGVIGSSLSPMLEKFRRAKEEEVSRLRVLEEQGYRFESRSVLRRDHFLEAIKEKAVSGQAVIIAEYKRASPSLGEINLALSPLDAAQNYADAGAAAISVLTEERYFSGSIEYIEPVSRAGLPVLRKDFIIHPLQIAQTSETEASAVLVIVRMLSDSTLEDVLAACERYGLEPVVEVFSMEDLARAQRLGVRLIQVNNRDLNTLKMDFAVSRELIRSKREGEFWVSASGYRTKEQLEEMRALGFDAFLVGSSLMGNTDAGGALASLMGNR